MILAHLTLFRFLGGASGTPDAGDSFSGFTTHMPFAFFAGFGGDDGGGGGGTGPYIPTFRRRRR